MRNDLDEIVKGALYTEVRTLTDGKSIVMDPETEHLYYRKVLSVYSVPVFRFLKENSHRNLPSVHLFWQEEGNLVVIEELIQGKTLEEVLESKEKSGPGTTGEERRVSSGQTLPFEEKKRILLEICDGLEFLHNAKPPIIHRDIKASNIMLTSDGTVKIIDYDAAKQFVADKSRDTVLMGTQGLAAPEQYGFGQSDQRTDIFALGQLIKRMLPDSAHAMKIVEKATKLQPELRYKNVSEVRDAIEKLWDPAIPDSVHRKQQLKKKIRSKKTKWVVVSLLIVALLTAGGIYFKKEIYPEYFVRRPAYEKGIELMNSGKFKEAIEQFKVCGTDYKDCKNQIRACELELVRDGYVADAKEKIETWKSTFMPADEINALNSCLRLQKEGIDNGEQLQTLCNALLDKSSEDISNNLAARTVIMYSTLVGNLTSASEPVSIIRDNTIEEYKKQLFAAKEYDTVTKFFTELTKIDQVDRTEEINECAYLKATDYLDAGEYKKAADIFIDIFEYKDSKEQKLKCNYLLGKEYMEKAKYTLAVTEFLRADGYADSDDLANTCKYYYCCEHIDNPDDKTRAYLKDLEAVNYTGADSLTKSVEEWKVSFKELAANDYEVKLELEFSGGPKEGMTGYRAVSYDRSGNSYSLVGSRKIVSGSKDTISYKNSSSTSASATLLRIEIYDSNGNKIGTYTR